MVICRLCCYSRPACGRLVDDRVSIDRLLICGGVVPFESGHLSASSLRRTFASARDRYQGIDRISTGVHVPTVDSLSARRRALSATPPLVFGDDGLARSERIKCFERRDAEGFRHRRHHVDVRQLEHAVHILAAQESREAGRRCRRHAADDVFHHIAREPPSRKAHVGNLFGAPWRPPDEVVGPLLIVDAPQEGDDLVPDAARGGAPASSRECQAVCCARLMIYREFNTVDVHICFGQASCHRAATPSMPPRLLRDGYRDRMNDIMSHEC